MNQMNLHTFGMSLMRYLPLPPGDTGMEMTVLPTVTGTTFQSNFTVRNNFRPIQARAVSVPFLKEFTQRYLTEGEVITML